VALTCRDEAELEALSKRLTLASIEHQRILEPDPPWNGALMALGLPPAYKSTYRRWLSNLPLVK
jgi:hypothetical protein